MMLNMCLNFIHEIIEAFPENLYSLVGLKKIKVLRAFINNSNPSEIGWHKDGVDGYGTYTKMEFVINTLSTS